MSLSGQMMAEFRIEADARSRGQKFRGRRLSWGIVVLLLGITVFLFVLGVYGVFSDHSLLRFLFVFTLLGTMIMATVLACREALRRAEREMVFVLDGDGIVRRREGWPDVKIRFSEVNMVREELRWLVIYSTEPRRKIAIPNDVNGFEVIRAELAKHYPPSAKALFPSKSLILPAISLLSWAVILLCRDAKAVIPAGVIALVTLAVGSHRIWALLHQGPKRLLMWLSLGFTWLSAILLIYIRLVRP